MNVDISWSAAETAQEENAIFQASNALSIMDIILLNEAQQVIDDVNAILKQHLLSQNEQVLFDNLKNYLSRRWDDIAASARLFINIMTIFAPIKRPACPWAEKYII